MSETDPRNAVHKQKGGTPDCGFPANLARHMTMERTAVTCDRCLERIKQDDIAAAAWNAYLGRRP